MLLGVTVLVGAGCQNKLADENKELWRQNRELQAKLSDSESQRRGMADPSEVQGLQQQLAERDAKISELEGQLRNPAP
ncbi:MAG: hypothetical protein ACREIT_08115, partial [Tepidisphaeraceae bacterium]